MSTEGQSDTLPHQRDWAIDTARKQGWRLDRIGDFEDASTGKRGVRKLVAKLLAEIEQRPPDRRPDWLLLTRLDRIGRGSIVESQVVIHRLKQLGVRVWTRHPGGEVKNESAMEELMVAIAATVARMENEVRAEKGRAVAARKRKAGQHYGHAPYGTLLVDGKPAPYEPEAAIVRALFEKRLAGWGYHRLGKWAYENAPPKRYVNGGTRALHWPRSTIGQILGNPVYRGVVVDAELFDAVQGVRSGQFDREITERFPLRGAVRCGLCGLVLSASRNGKRQWVSRYYICRSPKHGRTILHHAFTLEQHFLDLLRTLSRRYDVKTPDAPDLESLKAERLALQAQRENIDARRRRAWELAEENQISGPDLGRRIAEIASEQLRIDGAIGQLDEAIAQTISAERARQGFAEAIASMADSFQLADHLEQREMAQTVAEIVGGLYALPPPPRRPKETRLLTKYPVMGFCNSGFDHRTE